jgi:hypothetical protein
MDTRKAARPGDLKVVNTSITIAYDVTVQPRETRTYKAKFETIPRLEKDHPAFAIMDLRREPGGSYFREFEMLLKLELQDPSEEDGFNVRVPLIVRFYDSKKEILYQTAHEVVYNTFSQEAHIYLTQGTIPVKMPYQSSPAALPVPTDAQKQIVRYIMYGAEQLLAYNVTVPEAPARFLVQRLSPKHESKSLYTEDFEEANTQWNRWYKEWQKSPTGFGGASGNGMDGKPPW